MARRSLETTGTNVVSEISLGTGAALGLRHGIGRNMCGKKSRGRPIHSWWGSISIVTVFLMLCPFTVTAFVVVSQSNQAVFPGSKVSLECTRDMSSRAVDWEFAPADSANFTHIYTDRRITANYASRYRIDTDNETQYDIIIDSVDTSHAGTYICTPDDAGSSSPRSSSAQLVVLESNPVCGTNATASSGGLVEGDYLLLWCAVNYTGNLMPFMDWNSTVTGKRGSYNSLPKSVNSSLTIPLSPDEDGVTIACKTSFSLTSHKVVRNPRPGETPAKNIPGYHHLWTFTPRVLYAPITLRIKPILRLYEVGDRLVCSAKGNPTPTYEWEDIERNRTIHGSVLTVNNNMISASYHDFRCTAYNTVAGKRREINEMIAFIVTASSDAVSTVLTGAAVPTALTAAILIAEITLGFGVAGECLN